MLWFATWTGAVVTVAGMLLLAKPLPRLGVPTRADAAAVVASGILLSTIALTWPARERRIVSPPDTHLQNIMPRYQFWEHHSVSVAASPASVMSAIRSVTASDIRLFRLLTWIRRGGRDLPEGILNAGDDAPILDIATRNGFVYLHQGENEIVIGTVIAAPAGTKGTLTAELFARELSPGWTLATMNFIVIPDPVRSGNTYVSTETRVFANDDRRRRQFAAYWRIIYPGSALIRRGWLGAIERRAVGS